jgi:hypothetical protein
VGAVGAALPQAAAKTQNPITTYRIRVALSGLPLREPDSRKLSDPLPTLFRRRMSAAALMAKEGCVRSHEHQRRRSDRLRVRGSYGGRARLHGQCRSITGTYSDAVNGQHGLTGR